MVCRDGPTAMACCTCGAGQVVGVAGLVEVDGAGARGLVSSRPRAVILQTADRVRASMVMATSGPRRRWRRGVGAAADGGAGIGAVEVKS